MTSPDDHPDIPFPGGFIEPDEALPSVETPETENTDAAPDVLLEQTSHTQEEAEDPVLSLEDQARLFTQGDLVKERGKSHALIQEKHMEARTDSLTGLMNRRGFLEGMTKALEEAQSGDIGLIYMDVDNFKRLNDSLGHRAGDKFLKDFAEWLNDLIHETSPTANDMLGRLGGDEFIIGVDLKTRLGDDPNSRPNAVLDSVGAKLTAMFESDFLRERPVLERIKLGISWGGAINGRGSKLAELLDMADREMYDNKYKKKRRE